MTKRVKRCVYIHWFRFFLYRFLNKCVSVFFRHYKNNIQFLFRFFMCCSLLSFFFFILNTVFTSLTIETQSEPRQYAASNKLEQQQLQQQRETRAAPPPANNCPRTCPVLTSPQGTIKIESIFLFSSIKSFFSATITKKKNKNCIKFFRR